MEGIEIPFGAKDSELHGFEYTIPDGYTAEIKDGKFVMKKVALTKFEQRLGELMQYTSVDIENNQDNAIEYIKEAAKEIRTLLADEVKHIWTEEEREILSSIFTDVRNARQITVNSCQGQVKVQEQARMDCVLNLIRGITMQGVPKNILLESLRDECLELLAEKNLYDLYPRRWVDAHPFGKRDASEEARRGFVRGVSDVISILDKLLIN